jgi:hypothetical protein
MVGSLIPPAAVPFRRTRKLFSARVHPLIDLAKVGLSEGIEIRKNGICSVHVAIVFYDKKQIQ